MMCLLTNIFNQYGRSVLSTTFYLTFTKMFHVKHDPVLTFLRIRFIIETAELLEGSEWNMAGKSPYVIAFANQKGGVGKTTSCVNIAASVGSKGYKVLLIDCDPQGNTTTGVGISKKSIKHSVYDALIGTVDPVECVVKTEFENLYIVPATINLAGAEFELFDVEHRERCLSDFISSLAPKDENDEKGYRFDFVMIDCPPSLSMLTVNALTAANGVIIPMQSEYYALEGLTQLMLTIKKVKQHYNGTLSILGILITMHNPRLNLSVQVLDELKKYYSDKLFKTMIPRAVKLSEAPGFGTPAMYHDKYSKGTRSYDEVSEEILHRIGFIL